MDYDLDDPETYDRLIRFGAKYVVFADERWWGKDDLSAILHEADRTAQWFVDH
jgi:hypothetical protein